MHAWRGWYHVNGGTYGTWLPGDPRGWRERHHKKHIDGDYKHPPPPGYGDGIYQRSQELLVKPPVRLDDLQREIAGRAIVEMLIQQRIQVVILSIDATHFHLPARFPDTCVRPRVGRAKKHAYFELRARGLTGALWENGTSVIPITGRPHQLNVFAYIERHKQHGAWIWTFREGVSWKTENQTHSPGTQSGGV